MAYSKFTKHERSGEDVKFCPLCGTKLNEFDFVNADVDITTGDYVVVVKCYNCFSFSSIIPNENIFA